MTDEAAVHFHAKRALYEKLVEANATLDEILDAYDAFTDTTLTTENCLARLREALDAARKFRGRDS